MPSWVSRNIGLDLNVNYIAIHPATRALPSHSHLLLAATDGGLYVSVNGGRQWRQVVLPDPIGGSATIDQLTFHWADYSPIDNSIIFALGVKVSTSQLWLYRSSDSPGAWISRLVATI